MGGGGYIHIGSGSARLVSFVIKLISKEISRAYPEYMNIHPPPPISVLAPALDLRQFTPAMQTSTVSSLLISLEIDCFHS